MKSSLEDIVLYKIKDDDGLQIRNALVYTFSRMLPIIIDFGMLHYVESPIFIQNGKFFYPSDTFGADGFPIGLDPNKHFRRIKGLGSLNKDEIYDAFFNPQTRRLIQVTKEGIDYGQKLVEDINERKKLLIDEGIITNPFGFKD